jgi:hypothetical protein
MSEDRAFEIHCEAVGGSVEPIYKPSHLGIFHAINFAHVRQFREERVIHGDEELLSPPAEDGHFQTQLRHDSY